MAKKKGVKISAEEAMDKYEQQQAAEQEAPDIARRTDVVGYGDHYTAHFADVGANRGLTKKAKASLDGWRGSERLASQIGFWRAVSRERIKHTGVSGVYVGKELGGIVVGIPLPSLALEALLQMTALPLSMFVLLSGPPDSNKSTFLYEMYRWMALLGGGGALAEAESKINEQWVRAIVSPSGGQYPIVFGKCGTQEAWQAFMLEELDAYKRICFGTKENPGPGKRFPALFSVDSLAGKISDERTRKIDDASFASKQFSSEAYNLTYFLPHMASAVEGWPVLFAGVAHVAVTKDDYGNEIRQKRGGMFKEYQKVLEIELQRRLMINNVASFEGYVIRLKTWKNSNAPYQRWIDTRLVWWGEDGPRGQDSIPEYAQCAIWDWHWSTAQLLAFLDTPIRAALKQKYGVTIDTQYEKSPVNPMIRIRGYPIANNDFVHFREMGRLVEADLTLKNMLRHVLEIRHVPYLNGDYDDQVRWQMEQNAV